MPNGTKIRNFMNLLPQNVLHKRTSLCDMYAMHACVYVEDTIFWLSPTIESCKALHDQASVYLVQRCVRATSDAGRARLRSASSGQLVVQRTSKKTFGDKALACSGPISWNCLSSLVRDDCLSLHSFKKLLKTALF